MIILKKRFSVWHILILVLLFLVGCSKIKGFSYGIEQISTVHSKYKTSIENYPNNLADINKMLQDLNELKKQQLEAGQEPFNYFIDYNILNLEAEKYYIGSEKYGDSGTTKNGFGCTLRPLILESAELRNKSAIKGFEAVTLMREFMSKYPKEANLTNLSNKSILFLNATFYRISKDALKDSQIINNFCPSNETLEIYKAQFKKQTNLSEQLINNLTYEQAVEIWKELKGIN